MPGFFDRFRDSDKLRLREEERAEKEAADLAAREALAEQRRKQETADRIRDEERMARSQWTYQEIGDEMRGTTMSMAQLISENSVDFPFPYNGGCQGMLALRKNGNAIEALFTITNGQLDGVNDYRVNTKVDGGSIQSWSGNGPDQGSHTLMFMTNPVLFIRHFQKGERMIFEAFFYQHGKAQFTFNVAGLDPRFQVR
jgi:hypothetical protein